MTQKWDFGSHDKYISDAFKEGVNWHHAEIVNNLAPTLFRLRRMLANAVEWNEDDAVGGALEECSALFALLEGKIADVDSAKTGGSWKTQHLCKSFVSAMYDNLVQANCDWTLADQELQELKRNGTAMLRQAHKRIEDLKAQAEQRVREHDPKNPEVRAKVLALTGGRCAYCNTPISDQQDGTETFAVEHVVAKDNGGPDHLSNYVPSCPTCNSKKRTAHVLDFIQYRLAIVRGAAPVVETFVEAAE